MNRIFEALICNGKSRLIFISTDDWQVSVAVPGIIENRAFLQYLERLGQERLALIDTTHFLALDHVFRDDPVPEVLRSAICELVDHGAVERIGRGRGTQYILSRGLYAHMGEKGTYTRERRLDRETNKALLMIHICDNRLEESRMAELRRVPPSLSRYQVRRLLYELRDQGGVLC